jgi:hypothetical protein
MPNSFYRFQPAWNAGFYPDNQITSNLLNEVESTIGAWLPGYFTGKTISELIAGVQSQLDVYNTFPYFGDFKIVSTTAPDPPFVDYYIYIRSNSLYPIDNTQELLISGQYNPLYNLVINATLSPFSPGSYSGTFDYSPIPVEAEVDRALQIVEQNGSAFFPMTYSFNSGTNIATSGLARGKNWQLDSSGNATRLPADTLPKQNAKTFSLAAQTAEDRYCISLMEKVINFSLTETNSTLIGAYYATFTIPDGWTASFNVVAGTYDRIFCLLYRGERSLLMIGRLDTNWLWQRFVSDSTYDYTYFNAYVSTTALPYLPLASYQWLFGDWYDMEFVDYSSGCYVSPEFYAMPAIPGDNWQFNVPSNSGNLTGLNSALVGLFTQDGQFIQQIGSGLKPSTDCDCVPCVLILTYQLTEAEWATYLTNVSQLNDLEATNLNFGIYKNDVEIEFAGISFATPTNPYTFENIQDAGLAVNPPVVLTFADGVYTFNCTIADATCGDNYKFNNQISDATVFPTTWITIFTSDSFECPNVANTTNQLNASCTIPAVKNGCYRLGLYNEPVTTCDLTFTKSLLNEDYTAWINSVNAQFGSANPFIGFSIYGGTPTFYVYPVVSATTTALQISDWVNTNIPGMTSTWDEIGIYFTWIASDLACGNSWSMLNCVSQEIGDCVVNLWQTDFQDCVCGNSYYLYSLSNIINIDGSDCFSTMLEFWANDNSIAQGFEYFNGWKQRVRLGLNGGGAKPVIEENVYRQSNGVHRRPQNKQDLSLDLHTDFIDEHTQLALVDATRHPYLVWNNKSIFVKGDLDVATIQDFTTQSSFETLAQVKFSALVQGFQPKNSSCLTC